MTRIAGISRIPALWLSFILASAMAAPLCRAQSEVKAKTSIYSNSTVVVYNTNVEESRDLAAFYAQARGISPSNIVALTCPDREQISRKEYEDTILKPLRDAFTGNDWWNVTLDPTNGIQVIANRIHVIVLIYGMPLKIANNVPAPSPKADPETGKETPSVREPFSTTGCSVDSELCLLGAFNLNSTGPLKNPYHQRSMNFYQARIPGMMLVGRIDGPDAGVAKRMITDAIAAEETGLWGMAYVDQAQKLKTGDDWLLRSAELFERQGIPVVLDSHRSRFPENYPMRNASLYFGWYAFDVEGPFLNPQFRFNRGAVACHLHSYSAETLRTTTTKWAAPLLDRGAAAVLGNVYEPYLNFTHHFDIFNERLLKGFTFVESAYMALPALSWMNVAIGDPLYRPFEAFNNFDEKNFRNDENAAYKALRLAARRWGGDESAILEDKLESAGEKLESGVIYEALALRAARELKYVKAEAFLEKALVAYQDKADHVRIRLHQVDFYRLQGKKEDAIALLELIPKDFAGVTEAQAAQVMLEELRPPLPPLPPPPGKTP